MEWSRRIALAAMAAAQNCGWFRYAWYEPTGGLVKRPSVKPPCSVSSASAPGRWRTTGVTLPPTANVSGFASIVFGDGSAWFTNYDRGTLTSVSG
jgi:hypothetical protein